MKKPALRKNRFKMPDYFETKWTESSSNIGEYIFRRLSIDQSNKELRKVRTVHQLSQLIVTSSEINRYANDYLDMVNRKRPKNSRKKYYGNENKEIEYLKYIGHN